MQPLLEFIPVLLFFLAYFSDGVLAMGSWQLTLGNIYSATLVLMVATIAQVCLSFLLYRRIEKRNWAVLAIVLVFGSLTLLLKNNLFIQWKPTIANWCFALALLLGPFFTRGEPLIKKISGNRLQMPMAVWARLTRTLIVYFFMMGVANLFVVYLFSEASWVKFKFWSTPIASILLSVLVVYMVHPYLDQLTDKKDKPSTKPE